MQKKVSISVLLVLVALISFLFFADKWAAPEAHEDTIASIDMKIQNVKGLTAGSAIASAIVSALPDDTATPIADKLADVSSYFIIVLCALYLEKYLVTLTGFAFFKILIPIACACLIFSLFQSPQRARKTAARMLFLGFILYMLVPVSVKISDMIYQTYNYEFTDSSSIDADTPQVNEAPAEDPGHKTGILGAITSGVNEQVNEYAAKLNNYMQKFAIMVVTSCLIPLVVLFFFLWLSRMILGIDKNGEITQKLDLLLKSRKYPL